MITLKNKIINIFDAKSEINLYDTEKLVSKLEKIIEEYERTENYGYIECPNCHSDKLIGYGKYERNIGILGKYKKIRIKRVMCKECGHTHAIIPEFILPFYQSERSFIIRGVKLVLIDKIGIVEVERKLEISRQELNSLVKRFISHMTRLKTTFKCSIEKTINSLLFDMEKIKKYELINGIRLMEKVPT